jgi:hypothetical protein
MSGMPRSSVSCLIDHCGFRVGTIGDHRESRGATYVPRAGQTLVIRSEVEGSSWSENERNEVCALVLALIALRV